jgi:DNA-binding beta-propeller fold protein YncE
MSGILSAQSFVYHSSIGKFKDATSFYITSSGFIYVTDASTDEVYKLDTLGNVLKYAGGYGWDGGLFDDPSDVFANPLSVYVCDKNNHRIERFDKYLNYISLLYTRDSDTSGERFGYPLSCAVSQQGDLYILDSENKRIVKFDLFGNFVLNFGGYDAGKYALSDPQKLAISQNNDIYVIDDKRIVIFDQYGNGLAILNSDEKVKGINIIFNNLTVNTDSKILFANLTSPELILNTLSLTGIDLTGKIISSFIFNNKLYLLTGNEILIFNHIK